LDDRAKLVKTRRRAYPHAYGIRNFNSCSWKTGKVYSSAQIYETVWNESAYRTEGTVAVHIRHLREKLEINPAEPRYLKVVWGQGYKMERGNGK
jgi:ribosomal protein L31E